MLINTSLKRFERVIVVSLIVMMVAIIVLSTVELGWLIVRDIVTPPFAFLPSIGRLLEIFGFFLIILIGVELLETIKAYLQEHVVHVEIVLEVALIAVARKVIILDVKDYPSATLMAIAMLIVALAIAYFLERRARRGNAPPGGDPAPSV